MGQNSSVPLGGRCKSFRSGWRSPFPHRSRCRQGNLSATFNVIDMDTKLDQLNVNTASEEELMTLPGVSRVDAHNIVEYRQRLGRFNKVEDLALVSGIGADKLAQIRPEICVGSRRSPSCASSRAQSVDSLPSAEFKPSPHSRQHPLLNVNTATVFELQTVPGLTQEIAANIVDYRDSHGPYTNLDQLAKVKGLNHIRLGAVRSRLCVHSEPLNTPVCNGFPPSLGTNQTTPKIPVTQSVQTISNGKIPGHRKTMSAPIKYTSVPNGLAVRDILDVLSACSQRPIVEEHFDGRRKGKPALRLASWNLSGLSVDKAENPGVREVLCRTILENRFSLMAVQEVLDIAALRLVCEELNFPTLRRVKEWKENSHKWSYQSCKGLAFVWDGNDGVSLSAMTELRLHDTNTPVAEALLAEFKLGGLAASLINVHLQGISACENETDAMKQLQSLLDNEPDILIVLGDFSALQVNSKGEKHATSECYVSVIPPGTSTNSIIPSHHSIDSALADNIFLNRGAQNQFTETSGIVRQGLTHLAIPRGWSWGGPASEHCPVWCELFTDQIHSSPSPVKK